MFSKIEPKATILSIISLIIVALVLHILPPLGFVLCLFATIPGIVLWHKSKESFGLAAVITVILTTLLGNIFVLSTMVLILIVSFLVGQLLKERTSKERILYVTTTFISIISLVAFMILQALNKIPTVDTLIKPLRTQMLQAIEESGVQNGYENTIGEGLRQFAVQLPSYVIITIFLLILINLIITFPILRKFKVATPVFKPLFAWQMNKVLLILYVITLLCVMFASKAGTFQIIVLNF